MKAMQEAIDYFSRPGFRRLFLAARKKVESLGRIGGEVRLFSLTPEEQEALSGLLARDLYRQKSVAVKLGELDERLRETRFAIGLMDLLYGLFGEEIKPNRLKRMEQEENWKQWIQQLQARSVHPGVRFWLSRLEAGEGQGYRTLREWFEQHSQIADDTGQTISEELYLVIRALDNLPAFKNEVVRLPIFAAGISGDPHFLDRDRLSGRLFYYGMVAVMRHWRYGNDFVDIPDPSEGLDDFRDSMKVRRQYQDTAVSIPEAALVPLERDSEAIRRQYRDAGLLLDDLSSYVLIGGVDYSGVEYSYGLTLRMVEKWSGKLTPEEEELVRRKRDIPAGRLADASRPSECFMHAALYTGRVYVTENPSVLSGILDRIHAWDFAASGSNAGNPRRVIWSPLVCTSGQPSHAAIRLFDCLTRLGIQIYYSGDFDLKGLEIATALQKRYPGFWNPWGLKYEALLFLKNNQDGIMGVLPFSEEEQDTVRRLEICWDDQLPEALGNTKVFEEMIFSYLWEVYRDGHVAQMG